MRDRRPLDALFQPAAISAVVLSGESLALMLTLGSSQPSGARLVQFGLASLGIQWTALGTLSAIYLFRRALSALRPNAVGWACLALLLAMTLLVALAASRAVPSLDGDTSFVWRMLALALVVGLLALVAFQNHWRAQQLVVRGKQLELEALQARVRPHFLFNTLNTGAALVHARPDEAQRVLLDLADLFRAALSGPQLVLLAQELDLTRRYLEIESLRFGERLRIRWDVPSEIPVADVPSLSLQPLAENAIRHGIERIPGGGTLDIGVREDAGWVEIVIANDLPQAPVTAGGHAVGLRSARERVHAMEGGRSRLDTRTEGGRYIVTVRLPLLASQPST